MDVRREFGLIANALDRTHLNSLDLKTDFMKCATRAKSFSTRTHCSKALRTTTGQQFPARRALSVLCLASAHQHSLVLSWQNRLSVSFQLFCLKELGKHLKNALFVSTFPMFVPSLSWQNDRFYISIAQKGRFVVIVRT
eukprot:COSAG06_NODE_27474_length_592_cov_1.458418_2_plen_138_part_01